MKRRFSEFVRKNWLRSFCVASKRAATDIISVNTAEAALKVVAERGKFYVICKEKYHDPGESQRNRLLVKKSKKMGSGHTSEKLCCLPFQIQHRTRTANESLGDLERLGKIII